MGQKTKNVDLVGIVTAFDWDDNDKVNRVSLCVGDEEEYLIDDDKKGKELLKLLKSKVRALGECYLDENKNLCLKLQQFTLL